MMSHSGRVWFYGFEWRKTTSTKMPVALIDVLAGHQLKEAVLLALLRKERTGAGSLVEVSLLQTAIVLRPIRQPIGWWPTNFPHRKDLHILILPFTENHF